jgi:hypothetical protein
MHYITDFFPSPDLCDRSTFFLLLAFEEEGEGRKSPRNRKGKRNLAVLSFSADLDFPFSSLSTVQDIPAPSFRRFSARRVKRKTQEGIPKPPKENPRAT